MRALLVSLLLLAAAAPAAAQVPPLGRTTDVGGGAPASTLVDVPHAISLDHQAKLAPPIPELRAGGQGLAVIDLRRLGATADRQMQIQFYFSSGRALGWIATMWSSGASNAPLSLRAGRYRMTVASTDALRARLTFPTLDGDAAVTPSEPEPSVAIGELPASPVSPPGTVAFGADGELAQAGEILVMGRVEAREEEVLERASMCFFEGGGPPIGAAAYEPGCPSGRENSVLYPAGSRATNFLGLYDRVPAGRSGAGWNFSRAGATPDARGWALWLPVRTDGAQPDSEPEPPAAAPAPPQARGSVSIPARALRVRRGRTRVPLRCSADGPCAGSVGLGRRSARFTLPAGRRGHVVLRVPRGRRATVLLTYRTATGVAQSRLRLKLRRR